MMGKLNNELRKDKTQPFDQAYVFNNHYAATEKFDMIKDLGKIPDNIIAVAYHRRFIKKENGLFSENQPQLIGNPVIIYMPAIPTGRRIYEEVWS